MDEFPLEPYDNYTSSGELIATKKHILKKHKIEKGFHIKTIIRSAISEHYRHDSFYDEIPTVTYKSVR